MSDDSALASLSIDHRDEVAIAVSDGLLPDSAAHLLKRINDRLDQAGVAVSQRTWIVATAGDDAAAARIAAAISDVNSGARVIVHDPREPDGLTFQRRNPKQRRGGVYLNHVWQSASVRIGCGDGLALADGLSAWFNSAAQLSVDDLNADLLLRG